MAFKKEPGLERLIELRSNDPDAYDKLSAQTKLRVGYYEPLRAAELARIAAVAERTAATQDGDDE